MAKHTKALLVAICITALLVAAVLGGLFGASVHHDPHTTCVVPTALMYPPGPSGGLGYVDWIVPAHQTSLTFVVDVHKVAPDTFVQVFDGKINGVPQYFGLQVIDGHGEFIASRFGNATTAYVHPFGSAVSSVGTNEGAFASIHQNVPSLHGVYTVNVSSAGNGWFSYSVNGHSFGALWYGKGSIGHVGGSWLEDFNNNGTTFVKPGLTHVTITPTAGLHGLTQYSDVPDTNIWTTGSTVHFDTGGNTARCFAQGQVAG
jgi:hypothetical protein